MVVKVDASDPANPKPIASSVPASSHAGSASIAASAGMSTPLRGDAAKADDTAADGDKKGKGGTFSSAEAMISRIDAVLASAGKLSRTNSNNAMSQKQQTDKPATVLPSSATNQYLNIHELPAAGTSRGKTDDNLDTLMDKLLRNPTFLTRLEGVIGTLNETKGSGDGKTDSNKSSSSQSELILKQEKLIDTLSKRITTLETQLVRLLQIDIFLSDKDYFLFRFIMSPVHFVCVGRHHARNIPDEDVSGYPRQPASSSPYIN
jgi:hypothetical protein